MARKPDEAGTDQQQAEPMETQEVAAPPAKGVTLHRGEDTVVAHRPTTITRLKSQGWTEKK